eukprot:TRINITY_DN9099_c0_g3_i1.p3 TRINITY_DN9099_c0_g3~~TRINITY_DN9099_c0_g3_i1.p3  ORF type:complete len:174 (-),score=16.12 TRINITY_DN9099_c0_g3_i1:200-664(-)
MKLSIISRLRQCGDSRFCRVATFYKFGRAYKKDFPFRSVNEDKQLTNTVQEMDIILYNDTDKYRLGHVLFVDKNCESLEVEPLSLEQDNVWKVDMNMETSKIVAFEDVIQKVDADYGQKQDMDRVRNPHSEHAYEIWEVNESLEFQIFEGGKFQ